MRHVHEGAATERTRRVCRNEIDAIRCHSWSARLTPQSYEAKVVADADNHRILFWDVFPTEDGQAADGVLGQSDFDHVAHNDDDQDGVADAVPSARTLNGAGGFLFLRLAGKRLYVGDFRNNRLLFFLGR